MRECVICKEAIDEERDRYVRLTDFNGKIEVGEVFNHLQCWKERFQLTNSKRKQAMIGKTMDFLKTRLDRGGIPAQ